MPLSGQNFSLSNTLVQIRTSTNFMERFTWILMWIFTSPVYESICFSWRPAFYRQNQARNSTCTKKSNGTDCQEVYWAHSYSPRDKPFPVWKFFPIMLGQNHSLSSTATTRTTFIVLTSLHTPQKETRVTLVETHEEGKIISTLSYHEVQ